LQDIEFSFQLLEQVLQALAHIEHFQNRLLLFELERQVRCDRISQPAARVDARERSQDFRRDFLVELHILVELSQQGATHRLDFVIFILGLGQRHHFCAVITFVLIERAQARALHALDQHLDRAIGQFQQLQNGSNRANRIDVGEFRIVFRGVGLRSQKDMAAFVSGGFQRLDRFGTPNEERDHHVRKNHHIAQRQHRQGCRPGGQFLMFRHFGTCLSRVALNNAGGAMEIQRADRKQAAHAERLVSNGSLFRPPQVRHSPRAARKPA